MYCIIKMSISVVLVASALASITVRRSGWLDRVVEYHKQNFYKDMDKIAPVQLNVSLEFAPPGYEDSNLWNYDSVIHLLVLIRESGTAEPVRYALSRMIQPTRRFMSKERSFKVFPSMMKYYRNEFYYDIPSSDEFTEPSPFLGTPDDDAVIVVANPVEARLPSARISVKLLREILDARAEAARSMPPTTVSTFSWRPMNKTTRADTTEAETGAGGSDATEAAGSGDGGDAGSGDGAAGGDAGGDAEPTGGEGDPPTTEGGGGESR